MDDAVLTVLRAIRYELRVLRGDLAARARGALAPADRTRLKELLPAIRDAIGEASFSVASLAEHARLTGDRRLTDSLAACGSTRAAGKLLKRAAGHDVDSLVLYLIGDDPNVFLLKGAERLERSSAA